MSSAMGNMRRVVAGGLLAVALAGCSSANGDGDVAGADTAPSPSEASGSASTVPAGEEMVTTFSDSFDDDRNGWSLPPTENATSEMVGGDFVWVSKVALRPHLVPATLGDAYDAGTLSMTDVVVSASVTRVQGGSAVAVFCREVPDNDGDWQWYEFVARDGYAAIRLADLAGNLDVLAQTRSVHMPEGKDVALQGSCVDQADGSVALGFTLDGASLLTAHADHPLGNGAAGLQSYDPEDAAGESRIAWHDFSVAPADS